MRQMREDRGFTLVELLLVMMLGMIVLGATLSVFTTSYKESDRANKRNETAETARNGLETLAYQLRNLALRVNNVQVIARLTGNDFIFQTSDPKRTWVRYCLDTTQAPATTERGRLWEGTSTNANLETSMTAGCPGAGSGWDTKLVADNVTNAIGARSIFSYSCAPGSPSTCPSGLTEADRVVNVGAQLFVDTTPAYAPPEQRVATAVYLRNQNQAPVARWTSTPSSSVARTVIFNGSGSSDAEGRTLRYLWFKTPMPTAIDCNNVKLTTASSGQTLWGGSYMGEGITLTVTFPSSAPQSVGLVVCDPGARYSIDGPRTVTVP